MTTDITELAQREKFEAWFVNDVVGADVTFPAFEDGAYAEGEIYDEQLYFMLQAMWMAWKAAGAELVEALEKAQAENTTGVAGMAESYETTISMLRSRIAELESRTVTAAAADVLAERQRQVTAEGWSPKHDDQYKNTELAFAASCYAFHAAAASWDLEDNGIPYDSHPVPKQWPWDPSWWRPTDARRDLVKAGALILAEIERLDRAAGIKVEAE
ncbi:hypothetical protein [Klebsiella quasipneumoniae]|uniref:hypothetical protein n=1 Tax=Klebsiella quasipneumoniae TaxID=1463165 RepID=UPI00388F91F3|nr:hypothetical protein [Klebsiella quasipneumoniae subsp. quasipneumoniae]HCQ8110307.1 hypothetical protein [Klebsiella quasipneumoniae subsp. similipneumoniae]